MTGPALSAITGTEKDKERLMPARCMGERYSTLFLRNDRENGFKQSYGNGEDLDVIQP